MPTISSLGVGSGLDLGSIISGLMEVEQIPLQRLQRDKAEIGAQISEFGQIQSSIASLNTAIEKLGDSGAFDTFKASSSDDSLFTASVTNEGIETNHSIEVISLAQTHRLASAVFTSETEEVGEGTLSITAGSNNFSVDVSETNKTLADIRDAINDSAQNKSVKASIINVDGGSRLVLSALNSGVANSIQVNVTGDDDGNDADALGLSRLVYQTTGVQNMSEVDAAQDASITVDGFAVESESNFISGVIAGVTIDIKQVGTATLSVSRDIEAAESAIDDVVKNYNALMSTLDEVRSKGALGRDSMLYGIQDQLRTIFSTVPDGFDTNIQQAFSVGFDFSREGTLSFESDNFKAQVSEDFADLLNFFTDSKHGLSSRLGTLLDGFGETGGIIDSRTDGLRSQERVLDSSIDSFGLRLVSIEERYRQQFTAMDSLVASLNSTGSYLSQQLNNLPGATFNS